MSYDVQTAVFAGPFDLLLHLILSEEVDLYEISLSGIIDAYIFEIQKMESINLEVATEFLLIAATLVELKARRLLPIDAQIDLDDELALWEERDLLLGRLLECKTFKDAAQCLQSLANFATLSYPRTAGMEEQFFHVTPNLLAGITENDIHKAYIRAITPKPVQRVDLFHVAQIKLSVAEAVVELLDELPRSGRISFRTLTSSFVDRLEIVIRFLALLEMFKQGYVELDQGHAFGDIEIIWQGNEALEYDSALADLYEG